MLLATMILLDDKHNEYASIC